MAFIGRQLTAEVNYNSSIDRVTITGQTNYDIIKGSGSACITPWDELYWNGRVKIGAAGSMTCSNYPALDVVFSDRAYANTTDTYYNFQYTCTGKYFNDNIKGKTIVLREWEYPNNDSNNQDRFITHTNAYTGNDYPCNCARFINNNTSTSLYAVGLPPNTPAKATFYLNNICGENPSVEISVTSSVTDVLYFNVYRATGYSGTYSYVGQIDISGSTLVDSGVTDSQTYYYKVGAYNGGWEEFSDITSIVAGINNPEIVAKIVPQNYPILTYTAETTNFCSSIDEVRWYLNSTLTGTTTGNTFSGLLPNQSDVFVLTAKYYKNGLLTSVSNSINLQFFNLTPRLSGFTSNGNMVIPSGYNRMNYLLVGGGANGGYAYTQNSGTGRNTYGGGGGAGGFLSGSTSNVVAGTYPVVIGAGGVYQVNAAGATTFSGKTAGAGGGGGNATYPNLGVPNAGNTAGCASAGSGGGGGGVTSMSSGFGYGCAGTVGQGKNGANGATTRAGGGGGANANASAGSAGAGKSSSISGIAKTYSAGGGTRTSAGGGTNAAANTGNGGGGACALTSGFNTGGNGGSGVAYIYLYSVLPNIPNIPTDLVTTTTTCTGATITWVNNNTQYVHGNRIQIYSGSTWVTVASVASGATSYNIHGLLPLTSYSVRVNAYNNDANVNSDSITFATQNPAPFNLFGILNNDSIDFTWSINDSAYGISILPEIRVSGSTQWTTGTTLNKNSTSYTFTGLSFNTDYQVRFVRIGSEFPSDIYEFSTADFLPPTINGFLVDNDVTIEIVDTNLYKEYYEIYRKADAGAYSLLATIPATGDTYVDNNISSGITYTYKVRCKLSSYSPTIYSDYSNEIYVKIIILLAATNLNATNISYETATLTWVNNNTESVDGNYIQKIVGGIWTTIANVASGATSYNISGLTPDTQYYFRIITYGGILQVTSAQFGIHTLNPAPFNVSANTITIFYQNISWELLTPAYGDYIRIEYRICGDALYTVKDIIAYDATSFQLTGLQYGTCYEIRVVTHDNVYGDFYNPPYTLNIPVPNYPAAFCESTNFSYSGSTCGNSTGWLRIDNQEYFVYYDFILTDVLGNQYPITIDTYTGLSSGFYFLSAVVKLEYQWFYDRDTCNINWIAIEDYDTSLSLVGTSLRASQCGPFDIQYGRVFYNVSGVSSANTYTFYAFRDDLSIVIQQSGITSTNDFIINNASDCYYVMIVDDSTGCKLLIPVKCVPSLPIYSLAGIKNLWIAPWSTDLDYNYWSTADDDYFLEFEDTSFFTSTKIKEYLSITGGTGASLQWYSLPIAKPVVKLEQKLNKVRQGYVFTDTLTVAINYATADKWNKLSAILNPDNKWIYVCIDSNNQAWTGGYRHGARITTYSFTSGLRGEDDGYQLTITAQSENKLLTAIDTNYINNKIL